MTLDDHIADLVRKEVARQLAEQKPANSTFLSVREAAAFARVHPRTVRKWLCSNQLTRHGTDTRALVDRTELEAFLRRDPAPPKHAELSPEQRARRLVR